MLSMRENRLLVGWACAKVGYSLAEYARKLITRRLSMRENWLLVSRAYAKIGYSLAEHTQNSFGRTVCFSEFFLSRIPCHPFLCPLIPSLSNVLFSPLSRLCTLSPILCPLSYVSVPCFPSSVPCLMALLLVSCPLPGPVLTALLPVLRPLYPVYCPFLMALFYCSCPLLFCFTSSFPPSLVLCPLSFILARSGECEIFLIIYLFRRNYS